MICFHINIDICSLILIKKHNPRKMSSMFVDFSAKLLNLFGIVFQTNPVEKCNKCAWITLICNDEYLIGVLALIRSLKRSKTIYPIHVLVVEGHVSKETEKQIENEGGIIRYIQDLYPKQNPNDLAFQRFVLVWTKLRVFEMTDIADKCVYLEADMIVLQNLDELFQLKDNPNFAAVQTCICNPEKSKNYPECWKPSNCPHTHGGEMLNIDEKGRYFNSGLFLFHPNKNVFEEMLKCLETMDLSQFKFADQDFLNEFYRNKWICLPSIYNSLKTFSITHPNIWDLTKIKVIHYILAKPWDKLNQNNQPYENINHLWWEAHEYKS